MGKYLANQINPNNIKHRAINDKITKAIFMAITVLCALVIVLIVIFVFIKGISPFINDYIINGVAYRVNFWEFLRRDFWFEPPNIYGAGFIVINTMYVTFLALLIAVPASVFTSLFISKIAPKKIGAIVSYIIELLASIPSIIYGLFGVGIITKIVKFFAGLVNYQSAGGISTLATILVLAIMIIPTITMLSTTSINAVKKDIINGSLALGASVTQTNFKVVLTSAKSGIFAGVILGVGRALGEATAISMVAGNAGGGPTFNLFDTTRTLTTTMLLGLKETLG
ncbi:MAG: phosphate ABC transporter permease subunit PstC, partial [Erysipelotrichales bacterium]|nr:phosphate ABC transporter permease subunit PstC [Erysipelotrichales bacterium]